MVRNYKKPTMTVERFVADEYVAACHDMNKVYKFTCDASWTGLTGNTVYTNGNDGIPFTSDDVKIASSYHPCGETHEASVTDGVFIRGWAQKNYLGIPSGEKKEVYIWTGEYNDNVHCTYNLDMDSWETVKS